MQDFLTALTMIIGAFFMLIGGLGVVRFPDLYMRVSASTKASTLGAGFLLMALSIHFDKLSITMRSLATIAFLVISAPVAAHLITRAAYFVGIKLWDGTIEDELRGKYNPETKEVESIPFNR